MLSGIEYFLLISIILPFFTGLLVLVIPTEIKFLREIIASVTLVALFIMAGLLGIAPEQQLFSGFFSSDGLASFIFFFILFFGAINLIYAFGSEAGKSRLNEFYAYFLWTLGAAAGVVFSANMIAFLSFWGFLGLTLYMMIGLDGEAASGPAKKTILIVGGADALLILGFALLFLLNLPEQLADTTQIFSGNMGLWIEQPVTGPYAVLAFILLTMAAFSKAGAMPLHTWVPAASSDARPVTAAFLPGSLDKLLGIYFLYRICTKIFVMPEDSWMVTYLMVIGAVTIIGAVMMALVQHRIRRLLGYHAVSQVGYMILGIATLTPIGMAGGLFHMLNNAIYKSCLFLCAGNVETATGTDELDKLGGLGKFMPLTFLSMLIASAAISGVPPLNGFVSKWLIYRGLIQVGESGGLSWIVWLTAAMFGSALTLASFIKIIHSIFWSTPSCRIPLEKVKEQSYFRTIPVLILAGICLVFGIAYIYPLFLYVGSAIGELPRLVGMELYRDWHAGGATVLLVIALLIGLFVYWISGLFSRLRRVPTWVGGSQHDPERAYFPGTEFYRTIQRLPVISSLYGYQSRGFFDIYELGSRFSVGVASYFSNLHSGVLSTYVTWALVGLVVYLFVFLGIW